MVGLFTQNSGNNLNTLSPVDFGAMSLFCSMDTWVCDCGVGETTILSKQAIKTYRETSI